MRLSLEFSRTRSGESYSDAAFGPVFPFRSYRKRRRSWANIKTVKLLKVAMIKARDLAERGGFEPPVRFYPHNCLAGSPVRPLQHLSGCAKSRRGNAIVA